MFTHSDAPLFIVAPEGSRGQTGAFFGCCRQGRQGNLAEADLKPRGAVQWHVLDIEIEIDAALTALRVVKPDTSECKKALSEMIMTMDQSSGKN